MKLKPLYCSELGCNFSCWTWDTMAKHIESVHYPEATRNEHRHGCNWRQGLKMSALILLCCLLAGCAVKRAPQKFYHFAYCDKMNADKVHCDRWATPCGRLKCQ